LPVICRVSILGPRQVDTYKLGGGVKIALNTVCMETVSKHCIHRGTAEIPQSGSIHSAQMTRIPNDAVTEMSLKQEL